MNSGWNDEIFYNLFEDNEIKMFNQKYILTNKPNEYKIIGLYFWDDFIVSKGQELVKIPTIPFDLKYEEKIEINLENIHLDNDKKINNYIKWYNKPLIFGGSPELDDNIQWINIEHHIELVNFWNKKYREIKMPTAHNKG